MGLTVKHPGLLTTVQDLGRHGWQKHGVIVSGAMDSFALRIANLLVGNEENEAALELTLLGPKLQVTEDTLIAICGADLAPRLNGQAVPLWRSVFVPKDSVLECKTAVSGCRAYLAVAGGFMLEEVLGSKSTYLRAGIGGLAGRALQAGDHLTLQPLSVFATQLLQQLKAKQNGWPFAATSWAVSSDLLPAYGKNLTLRVLRGGQFEAFTKESQSQFFSEAFQITPQSDRMGYRLSGPTLQLEKPLELISEAVTAGTVQVPPEGQPIVLLADRQTTGGYPKIGQIASVDLPLIAQLKPGETVHFQEITLPKAQALYIRQEQDIRLFKHGLRLRAEEK